MNIDPQKTGILSENFNGIGTVTRSMVHARARELAVINGRSLHETNKSDWDQAKRELTGGLEMTEKEAVLDNAPESERWNPVPGSQGRALLRNPSEDEDADGRSTAERLVQEGVREAEHDQMVQAAKDQQEENSADG